MALSSSRWDRAALRSGAAVCAVCSIPFSIVARLAFDDDDASGWATLLAVAALFGFVLGAGVAAWHQERGTPLSHGIVTAGGVFIVAQLVFSLVRLASGESVNVGRILVSLTLALGAGLLGGYLGSFLQRQGVRPGSRR